MHSSSHSFQACTYFITKQKDDTEHTKNPAQNGNKLREFLIYEPFSPPMPRDDPQAVHYAVSFQQCPEMTHRLYTMQCRFSSGVTTFARRP